MLTMCFFYKLFICVNVIHSKFTGMKKCIPNIYWKLYIGSKILRLWQKYVYYIFFIKWDLMYTVGPNVHIQLHVQNLVFLIITCLKCV